MSAKFIKAKGERELELSREKVKASNDSDSDSGCSVESPVTPTTTPPTKPKLSENDAKQILEDIKSKGAARQFGSVSDNEFDLRYNPDIYAKISSNDNEYDVKHDKQIVLDMALFLSDSVIMKFVYELRTMTQRPLDAIHFTDIMHSRGINIRYLGSILSALNDTKDKNHNYNIGLSALITRSAKSYFKEYIINVPTQQLAQAVAHFLNCYLSYVERQKNNSSENPNGANAANKKKKNKKGKG